jgi:hypothetical protein
MMGVDTTAPARPSVDVAVPDEPGGRPAIRAWAALAARPVGIYLASRAVVLTAIWMASRMPPPDRVGHMVTFWDSGWYISTARQGYPAVLPMVDGHVAQSNIAFSPGFPLCIRVVHLVGFSYDMAALLVAGAAGMVAVVLLWLLLRRMWGDAAADRGVALFCFFPGAFVLSGAYAEPLMLALAVGSLLMLLSRRWVLAGVLAALATATTPHALALVPACAWGAATAIRQRREWSALAAPVLAPLGFIAFLAFLWHRTGMPDAYLRTHEAWDVHLAVADTWHKFSDFSHHPLLDMNITVAVAGTLVLAVMLVLLVRARPPGPVLAYTLGIVLPVMVTATMGARPRFLLTAFPLVAGLGRWLRGNAFAAVLAGSATLLGCFTVLSVHTYLATP